MTRCVECIYHSALEQQCRHDPPRTFMVMAQDGPRQVNVFPRVEENDWCGQAVKGVV